MAKINVRVAKAVEGGRGSVSNHYVDQKIDVPDDFRFLHNAKINENLLSELQKAPVSDRGYAIVASMSMTRSGEKNASELAENYKKLLAAQGAKPSQFKEMAANEWDVRQKAINYQGMRDPNKLRQHISGVPIQPYAKRAGYNQAYSSASKDLTSGTLDISGALGFAAGGASAIGLGRLAAPLIGRLPALAQSAIGVAGAGFMGHNMWQNKGPFGLLRKEGASFSSGFEFAGEALGIAGLPSAIRGFGQGASDALGLTGKHLTGLNSTLRTWMRGGTSLPSEVIPAPKNRFSGTSEAYSNWMASQSPKGTRYKPTYQTGIGYKGPSNISESVGTGGSPLGSGGAETEAAKTAEIIKKQFGIDITKIIGGKGFLPGEPYPFGGIDKSIKIKPSTVGFFSSLDPLNIYLRKSGINPETPAHETGHLLDYLTNTVESILSGKGLAFGYKKGQGQSIYKSDQPGSLFNILSQKALTPQVIARLDLSGYKQSKYASEGFARGFADVLGGAASPDVKKAAEAAMQHAKSILGKVGMTEDVASASKDQHGPIIENIKKIINVTDDPATKAKLEQHLKDVEEVFAGQMTSPVPPAPQPQKIPQPQQGGPKPFADPKDFGQVPEVPPGLGELVPVNPVPFPNPAIKPANGTPPQGVAPVQFPEPNIGPTIQGGAAPNPVQPVPMPDLPMPGPNRQPAPKPVKIPVPANVQQPKPIDVQQPKPAEVPEPQPQPKPQPVKPVNPPPVKVKEPIPAPNVPPVRNPFGDIEQVDYGFFEMGGYWLPAAPSFHAGQWATPAYIINSGRLEYNVDQ